MVTRETSVTKVTIGSVLQQPNCGHHGYSGYYYGPDIHLPDTSIFVAAMLSGNMKLLISVVALPQPSEMSSAEM